MKILSMDIESCTGKFINASMCSFGYCLADEKFRIISQEDILMNPIPRYFFNSRKKTDVQFAYQESEFRNSPRFSHRYDKIKSLFKDVLVIGYAVDNDVKYLNNACDYFNLPRITYKYLDVQTLHRVAFGLKTVTKLSTAAEPLQETFIEHRSDEDARMTLLVLKYICNRDGLSIKDVISKYAITLGENGKNDFTCCVCKFDELEKLSKDKVKNKNILLHKYLEKLQKKRVVGKTEFFRKAFCMEIDIQNRDIDLTREIAYKLNELGGRYVSSMKPCDYYVVEDKESFLSTVTSELINERNKKIKVMSYDEFITKLGELPTIDFSGDAELLKQHYERKETKKKSVNKITHISSKPIEENKNKSFFKKRVKGN